MMMKQIEEMDKRLKDIGTSLPISPTGGKGGSGPPPKFIPEKYKGDSDAYKELKNRSANGKQPCIKFIVTGKCDFGDKCNRCHEAANWKFSTADLELAKRELERSKKNLEISKKLKKGKGDGKGKSDGKNKGDGNKGGKGDGKGKDPNKKSDKVCYLFKQGKCTRGDGCWYKHE